jgi:hypothetical protein
MTFGQETEFETIDMSMKLMCVRLVLQLMKCLGLRILHHFRLLDVLGTMLPPADWFLSGV